MKMNSAEDQRAMLKRSGNLRGVKPIDLNHLHKRHKKIPCG
jgi:hypothetical protein